MVARTSLDHFFIENSVDLEVNIYKRESQVKYPHPLVFNNKRAFVSFLLKTANKNKNNFKIIKFSKQKKSQLFL